jgi:hypothetical protein
MRSILTFDLHADDNPIDIGICADRLDSVGWTATFFVPTHMLEMPELHAPLRDLASRGHELGTHAHMHDEVEKSALRKGGPSDLGFLERSAGLFADFFGRAPLVFRSPCWAYLGDAALDELERLGYQVDSSATPQRPGLLSSFPYDNRHMLRPRAPSFLRCGLLEVPTSTLLVPLGWPTFCTLRRRGSVLVANALALEAALRFRHVLVGQFHVSDLAPGGADLPQVERTWRDLIPRARGGIGARRWLRMTDRSRVAEISVAVMSRMARGDLTTFSAVRAEAMLARRQPSAAAEATDVASHATP